jgi:energy-converting hydrogenase Eha subunit B
MCVLTGLVSLTGTVFSSVAVCWLNILVDSEFLLGEKIGAVKLDVFLRLVSDAGETCLIGYSNPSNLVCAQTEALHMY